MKSIYFICGFFVLFAIISLPLSSQDYNPPYPRIGGFTFTVGVSRNMAAHVDILKDFDVICFPNYSSAALAHQALKPNRPVLATSGCFYAQRMSGLPEEWYYHTADGNRIPLFGNYDQMNLTTICPAIDIGDGHGPKRFIDHCLDFLPEDIDFSIFDGVFFDWWWSGPGYNAKYYGDLDMNGVIDKEEWGLDSVITVWTDGLMYFHQALLEMDGCDYILVNPGTTWKPIYPLVNGFNWEDWPIFNGPWRSWRGKYSDTQTASMRQPRFMLMGAAHRHFFRHFPTDPYKNNYRAVRFAFSSNLFTCAYFYVDEGNEDYGPGGPGHHGNLHFYDEFEAKGMLGYPVSDMIMIPGKPLAPTPMAEGLWVRYFDHGVSVVNATGLDQTVSASELSAYDPVGGSSYYRFRGGQDPVFNNGEAVTDANPLVLWGDTDMANWSDPEVFGDGAMLFRQQDTLITPIIIDNNVNNQTSPGSEPILHLGTWTLTSDGSKFYAFYPDRDYGPFQPYGHAWSAAGSGENVALSIPSIGLNAYYEISEWHGYLGSSYSNATNVPVHILYAGGHDTTVIVDQSVNMAQWNSLGVFPFMAGLTGRVEVSNDANGTVMADAIKFEFVRGLTAEEEDSLNNGGQTAMFSDITLSYLGDTQNGTSACCFADINNDGWPDLYLSRYRGEGSTDLCYINENGSSLMEQGISRGVSDLDDGSQGACWGDLDNDGNFDLVNGTTIKWPENEGDHNDVYRNLGGGYFTDVTAPCIASTMMKTRSIFVFDMDNDQFLDIFSIPGYQGTDGVPPWSHPNEVYHNEMAFAFSKLSAADCGNLEDAPACHGGTATDFDNDGDLDVIAANQTGDVNILVNDGLGYFTRIEDISSIGVTSAVPQAGTGITMGDVDNDGDLDMLLASEYPASKAFLYFNNGDGTFSISSQSWNEINGYMGGFADLDNDRDLDLVFAGYVRSLLNDGSGSFDNGPIIPYAYPSPSDARSIAFADIDNDGDLDFAVTDIATRAHLIQNDFNNGNHYLKVKVISPNGQAGGFGAKVYCYPANQAGGQLLGFREIRSNNGFCGQDDPVVHFGLGEYTATDIVVIYQDGSQQTQTFSSVDRTVEMDGRDYTLLAVQKE